MKPLELLFTAILIMCNVAAFDIHPESAQRAPGIFAVAWSPDGNRLAAGDSNGGLRTISVATGQTLVSFVGHTSKILSVAWSPDGSKLASTGDDTTVRIWNAVTGQAIATYSDYLHEGVSPVRWSSDGSKVASLGERDGVIFIRTIKTGQLVQLFDAGSSGDFAWSIDNSKLALANGNITIIDVTAGDFAPKYYSNYRITSVAWSPDGNRIAGGSLDGSLQVWNTLSHQVLMTLAGQQSGMVVDTAWSPDGSKLAAASFDGTVQVWDTASWQLLNTFRSSKGAVYNVAWSPDSTRIAYADGSPTVSIVTISKPTVTL